MRASRETKSDFVCLLCVQHCRRFQYLTHADKEPGKLSLWQHSDHGELIPEETSWLCFEGNRSLLEEKMKSNEPLFSFP